MCIHLFWSTVVCGFFVPRVFFGKVQSTSKYFVATAQISTVTLKHNHYLANEHAHSLYKVVVAAVPHIVVVVVVVMFDPEIIKCCGPWTLKVGERWA